MMGSNPTTPSKMIGPKQPTITLSDASGIRPGMWIKIEDDFRPTFKLLGHEFKFQLPFVLERPFPGRRKWYQRQLKFRPYLIIRRTHKYRGVFQVKSVDYGTTITLTE